MISESTQKYHTTMIYVNNYRKSAVSLHEAIVVIDVYLTPSIKSVQHKTTMTPDYEYVSVYEVRLDTFL